MCHFNSMRTRRNRQILIQDFGKDGDMRKIWQHSRIIGARTLSCLGFIFASSVLVLILLSWDGIRTSTASCQIVLGNLHSDNPTLRKMAYSDIDLIIRKSLGLDNSSRIDNDVYERTFHDLSAMCDEHPKLTILQLGYKFLGVTTSN